MGKRKLDGLLFAKHPLLHLRYFDGLAALEMVVGRAMAMVNMTQLSVINGRLTKLTLCERCYWKERA